MIRLTHAFEVPGRVLLLFVVLLSSSPVSSDPGPFFQTIDGLHDLNVSALAWDGEILWVGTFDAGLAQWRDGRWQRIEIGGAPKHRWINALCWQEEPSAAGDTGSTLWIGSAAGLARWNPKSQSVDPVEALEGPVNSIRHVSGTLVVTGNDRGWIRRGYGWERFDRPGETLHAGLVDEDTLWTGGMWGALEQRGKTSRRYSQLNGRLPDSWVTALLPIGETVWVGTYDAGLVVVNDGSVERLREEAWVNFNALTRTTEGVAVGTMEDGLLLWNQSSRTWRRLTMSNGLPSNDVTAVVEVRDTLWVGTRGGVAVQRSSEDFEVASRSNALFAGQGLSMSSP